MNLDQACDLILTGQLLNADRLSEYRQGWLDGNRTAEEGDAFVHWLVDERQLSEFQSQAVLAGIPGPYQVGPYRVNARIVAGRLGDIYHAEHVEFQQPVSLKVFPLSLNQNPERVARLGREARVSLQLDSPYVVKTYQVGRIGPMPFIALEELKGETLEQRLNRDGRIPYVEACQLILQAAVGLMYVHSQDIVHRDICPANLWITDQGTVKIMEFGAARDALSFVDTMGDEEAEPTGNQGPDAVLGTYAYMSAAQAEDPNSADESSDLYSLGCTFYHCLTGQVPFPDTNPVRQMLRHMNEAPRPLSDFDPTIPQVVQEVVSYLLAKQPEDRYGSAEETAAALATIIPLAALPENSGPDAAFLNWVETVDEQELGVVPEQSNGQDWQQFVGWLSDHDEPAK